MSDKTLGYVEPISRELENLFNQAIVGEVAFREVPSTKGVLRAFRPVSGLGLGPYGNERITLKIVRHNLTYRTFTWSFSFGPDELEIFFVSPHGGIAKGRDGFLVHEVETEEAMELLALLQRVHVTHLGHKTT